MDTRMMEQFEIMDTEILDHIEGGDVSDIYRGYAYQEVHLVLTLLY